MNDTILNHKNSILLADIFFIYSLLAPIILNIVGSYVKLDGNFLRTFLIISGPALAACVIYINAFGFPAIQKDIALKLFVVCLILIIIISSLKNWNSYHTRESLKFFLAYCVFGFSLGWIASFTIGRLNIINAVWMSYTVLFVLYSLFLFVSVGFAENRFTLPGDNAARTAALFFFFSFCSLTNLLSAKSSILRLFFAIITITCVFVGMTSNTRSAIVVFMMILLCYFVFQLIEKQASFQKWSLISIVGVFVLSCLIWFTVMNKDLGKLRLSMIELPKQTMGYIFKNDREAYKKEIRFPIWENAISKFKENPFVGSGYGSEYFNEILKSKHSHPHSILLQFLAESGAIGLGLFLAFVTAVIKKAIDNYRRLNIKGDKLTYIFYPISFVFFLLFACFHFAIHENYFLWYFAGIITGFNIDGRVAHPSAVNP